MKISLPLLCDLQGISSSLEMQAKKCGETKPPDILQY